MVKILHSTPTWKFNMFQYMVSVERFDPFNSTIYASRKLLSKIKLILLEICLENFLSFLQCKTGFRLR